MAVPIWKDKLVSIGNSDPAYFRIKVGGDVIYQGKMVQQPGSVTTLYARINDICADWLQHARATFSNTAVSNLAHPVSFVVQKSTNAASWTDAETVQFWEDWSYDPDYAAGSSGFAFPITGRVDVNQPLVFMGSNSGTYAVTVKRSSGTDASIYFSTATIDSTFAPTGSSLWRSIKGASGYVGATKVSTLLGSITYATRLVFSTVTYDIVQSCGDWVLYYKNAYGGWDSLLIEGAVTPGDTLTRWEHKVKYDNSVAQNRGTFNDVNEVDRTYVLHTGAIDSAAAQRMHHLLDSPDVYLYNIGLAQARPVVITSTSHEYKTAKQIGGLIDFAITVRVAQDFERR